MGRTRARRRARPVSPPQFGLRFTDIFLDNERLPRFAVERELAEASLVELPAKIPSRIVRAICVHHRNKALSGSMFLFKELVLGSQDFKAGAFRNGQE